MKTIRSGALPLLCAMLASGLVACSDPPPPPAPPPPPVSENVRTFSVGGMTGFALKDAGFELPNDNKVLGVGRTPAEVSALLTAAGLSADKLSLSVQPLLVRGGGRVLLFDTGTGEGNLGAALAEAGITPESITDVFISHLHADHVGGLVNAAGDPVFTNATVRISEPEWETLKGLNDRTAAAFNLSRYKDITLAIAPSVAPFKPGADLLPGMVRAVEVKGHTPGHSAYRIGSGSSSLLYIGDSLHHHVVSVQKPEWTIAFDADAATAAASRASLLDQLATSGQRVYAVHFPFPGLGRFEKRDEGYAWVAE